MANWCGGIKLDKNTLKIIDGVICDANATPADATIAVKDADSAAVTPITGTTNQFLLSGLGDSYTVTVRRAIPLRPRRLQTTKTRLSL